MKYRKALQSDLARIESILKDSKLPYDDCKSHIHNFVVLEKDEIIIGIGGCELYNEVALLRSIAVVEEYRGKGLGNAIFLRIKDYIKAQRVKTIYLLTETAEAYFKGLGFAIVDRNKVPDEIKQTQQFSSLCPASATVMKGYSSI